VKSSIQRIQDITALIEKSLGKKFIHESTDVVK